MGESEQLFERAARTEPSKKKAAQDADADGSHHFMAHKQSSPRCHSHLLSTHQGQENTCGKRSDMRGDNVMDYPSWTARGRKLGETDGLYEGTNNKCCHVQGRPNRTERNAMSVALLVSCRSRVSNPSNVVPLGRYAAICAALLELHSAAASVELRSQSAEAKGKTTFCRHWTSWMA